MALHRLIHRLDYPFNEAICDRPGRLINVIMHTGGERYPEVKDNAPTRNLVADGESKVGTRWRIQVNPLTSVVGVEWKQPQAIGRVLKDPDVKVAFEVMDEVLRAASIDEVTRAGLRTFSYANLEGEDVLRNCVAKIDDKLIQSVSQHAGQLTDTCLVFEGNDGDQLNYSARTGPYFPKEQDKYFELLKGSKLESLDDCNFISDLDLFEKNFRIKGKGSYGWCRSLLDRAEAITSTLQMTGRR